MTSKRVQVIVQLWWAASWLRAGTDAGEKELRDLRFEASWFMYRPEVYGNGIESMHSRV